MYFRVEIGDKFEEFSFDRKTIFVGSDMRCQISLPYEGISAKHLKIGLKGDQVLIQNLSVKEPTYLNEEEFPTGKVKKLGYNVPIDIGGIYIYLIKELSSQAVDSVEEVDIDSLLGDSSSENNDNESNKFKRDLFAEAGLSESEEVKPASENTGTFSFDREALKQNSTGTRTIKTTVNKKNRKKRAKREQEKVKSSLLNMENIKMFTSFSLTVCLTVFIYYKFFNKDSMNKPIANPAVVSDQESSAKRKVKVRIPHENMQPFTDVYTEVLSLESCKQEILKSICNRFNRLFRNDKRYHISISGKSLNIGINSQSALVYSNKSYSSLSKDETEKIQQSFFSPEAEGISWNEFFDARFVHPNQDDVRINLLEGTMALHKIYFLEVRKFISQIQKQSNLDAVLMYRFSDFGLNEYEVVDFFRNSIRNLEVLSRNTLTYSSFFKSFFYSKLSGTIEPSLRFFGDTRHGSFRGEFVEKIISEEKISEFNSIVQRPKCLLEEEKLFCDRFPRKLDITSTEGVSVDNRKLYFFIRLENIENKDFENYEYNAADKKRLSDIYRNLKSVSMSYEDFFNNDFRLDLEQEKIEKNLMLIDYLKSDLSSVLNENKSMFDEVFFIAIDNDRKPRRIIKISTIMFGKDWESRDDSLFKYFYRSKLDLFHDVGEIIL